MKSKFLIATGISAAIVVGVLSSTNTAATDSGCVNLIVDYGNLKTEEPKIDSCISIEDGFTALDLVRSIGVRVTGTDKYGDQIVCLVNGMPEKADCSDMPPEDAYWAILVKHPGAVSEWNWADKGISDLRLKAGDSLALSYTVDNKVRWPK